MSRVPLPGRVRRGFDPFAEAVPLLFRIETLELAALTVAAAFALTVAWGTTPGSTSSLLVLFERIVIDPEVLARDFLRVAAVLLVVPIAAGDRGLQPRLLSRHFGVLAFAWAITVGVRWGVMLLAAGISRFFPFGALAFDWEPFWDGILPLGVVVWTAWFLGNAVRRREGRPVAPVRLLAAPGILIAVVAGVAGWPLAGKNLLYLRVSNPMQGLGYQVVFTLGWALLILLAALWMLRAVENEAEAGPAR